MEKLGKYIFYVFDTLTNYHVEMALQSIQDQCFDRLDFVLYNSSALNTDELLDKCSKFFGRVQFRSYTAIENIEPSSTLEDIQWQIKHIGGADFYIVHKADFFLLNRTIQKSIDWLKADRPRFINFCKIDLREYIVGKEVRWLARDSFYDIMRMHGSVDVTWDVPSDFSEGYEQYYRIGYRGWDGTMHCYNESARRLIEMDTFIQRETVSNNERKGIQWIWSDTLFSALHMFHEIPGGRGDTDKDRMGHRY